MPCLAALLILWLAAVAGASPWSLGKKTLLFIRIDFPDLPGAPAPDEQVRDVLRMVERFYEVNSYGKLSIQSTLTTTVRMPKPAKAYDHEGQEIITHARAAAKAAGFDTAKFNLEIVAFKTPDGRVIAVGAINAKGLRLANSFTFGRMAHELGHNRGLSHTQLWETSDGSIIGPGQRKDYGDPYDIMGGGAEWGENHLSIRHKAHLGWLGEDGIIKVARSGVYRIYAHDHEKAKGARGLRIARDKTQIYWVEFRHRVHPPNDAIVDAVRILRSYTDNNECELLDMTPQTPGVGHDAALPLGKVFEDRDARIRITPLKTGGAAPVQWIDVSVKIGEPAG